jgi:hypothetical protein
MSRPPTEGEHEQFECHSTKAMLRPNAGFKRAVTPKIRRLSGVIPHVGAGYSARFEFLESPLSDVPVT